ncbi:hypothetical protein PFISCL1PPCAC_1834, partial [Pristionchus fissidentatus]
YILPLSFQSSKMSMVYNHFTMIDAERKMYKCHYCSYTHMKTFSTTSNMVSHLRSKHPGIFPPAVIKRRLLGQIVRPLRPSLPPPSQIEINLFDDDVKPSIDLQTNTIQFPGTSFAPNFVSSTALITRSPSPSPVIPINGISPTVNSTPSSSSQFKSTSQPVHPQPASSHPTPQSTSHPSSHSIPRLSSPPPFSFPPSTSLPLPSTPEIEQLHARLLRAQIEREEAVARYYNALANRANTETSILREK